MSTKTVFLSHIHEEAELAKLIKSAVVSEFSGFVDVFVSSDGTSIPAGANFLKRIEDGLIDCIGAAYLISPASVKRNWINFELGAVWIRNAINIRKGEQEIPTIPVCHSGMTPSTLPTPLNNLNAIAANQASQLERSFASMQKAVGGKGALKTHFDDLASQVVALEKKFTLGASLKSALSMIGGDLAMLVRHCQSQPTGTSTTVDCGFVETGVVQKLKEFEAGALAGQITVNVNKPGVAFGQHGSVNGAHVTMMVPVDLVVRFQNELLAKP